MDSNKINSALEYISLILIISYFVLNNIILVIIGIILSLYLINISFISRLFIPIKKFNTIKSIPTELNRNYTPIESTKENIKYTLVEKIEELGYIPAESENIDRNAA